MLCYSIDLSGRDPSTSLLSYWLVSRMPKPFWVLQRGGLLRDADFACQPPSDEDTDEIVFVGNPLEGVEFANRTRLDGLDVSLLAIGVTEKTPPVSPAMLKGFKRVVALKETARWLGLWGWHEVEKIEMPFINKGAHDNNQDPSCLRIATTNVGLAQLSRPFKATVESCQWSEDGVVMSTDRLCALAARSDVCVVDSSILDDPIQHVFGRHGVPCVAAKPAKNLWERLAEAARLKRSEIFTATVQEGRDWLEADGPVCIGVVVPFGGLPLDGLRKMIKRLRQMALEDTPIVISHQAYGSHVDIEDEVDALQALADEFDLIGSQYHHSPNTWNMSRARNQGVQYLPDRVTHFFFLDTDILVDKGFFGLAIDEASCAPLVPFVENEDGTVRIASGLAIYPRQLFVQSGGFDERFVGWGNEDIDLLKRCRNEHGAPSLLLGSPSMPLLRHIDHAPRWVETRAKNCERLGS